MTSSCRGEELHRLFNLLASGGVPAAAVLAPLNARLARCAPKLQLKAGENRVSWVWSGPVNDPDRVLGPVLSSAAELLASGAYHRVRECRGEKCGWLFLDRSEGGAECGAAWPIAAIARRDGVTTSVSGP